MCGLSFSQWIHSRVSRAVLKFLPIPIGGSQVHGLLSQKYCVWTWSRGIHNRLLPYTLGTSRYVHTYIHIKDTYTHKALRPRLNWICTCLFPARPTSPSKHTQSQLPALATILPHPLPFHRPILEGREKSPISQALSEPWFFSSIKWG